MTLLARRGVIHARYNWGRWIADCPSPFCESALQLIYDQRWFKCWQCEAVAEIVWPSMTMVEDIETLVSMRPVERWRSWEPGQTLHDLYEENLMLGVLPFDLDAIRSQGSASFVLAADRIVDGRAHLANRAARQLTTGDC